MFAGVNPLADQFPGYSRYHYVHGDPVNLVDPTGMHGIPSEVQRQQLADGERKRREERVGPEEPEGKCCDFGGAAQELVKVVSETYAEAAGTLIRVVLGKIPDEGLPSAEDFHDSGDSQPSGSENFSTMEKNSNGVVDSPDATKGADNMVEIGPNDMAGGGGTGVNPVRRAGGTMNKVMPHAVDDKPDTTYVRQFGACEECKTDTIITYN